MLSKLSAFALSAATLAYPFAVYLAVGRVEPYWLATAICLLSLARAYATRDPLWLWIGAATALLTVIGVVGGHAMQALRLYPVLVNAGLLAVFLASVVRPPTVVERFARLADPLFPASAIRYTRIVTLVWCAFFVVNGAVALATALWASNEVWTFYNGFAAYVAMAALFAAEWLVRQRVKARLASAEVENPPTDLAGTGAAGG